MTNDQPLEKKIIQPARLPQQIAELLSSQIRNGALPAGKKLPSEAALGKKYGVSRTVIREALARLNHDGLIESRQGIGVVVAASDKKLAFRLDGTGLGNSRDVSYLYEMRAILAMESATLAAMRCREQDLEKLRFYMDCMSDAIKIKEDGAAPHRAFHRAIAEASGNPYLSDLEDFVQARLKTMMQEARERTRKTPGLAPAVHEEHEAVVQAIMSRDPVKAREAALTHIRNAAKRAGVIIFATYQ